MKLLHRKTFGKTLFTAVVHISLVSSLFVYFWLYGNTRLIYHAFGRIADYPLFFTGMKFFNNTANQPGGLTDYITGFLSQWYYYPLTGSIVITTVVSLTCLALAIILRSAGFKPLTCLIAYIPAVFFLAMHNRLAPPLPYFVPLLINLSAVALYQKFPLKNSVSRFSFFLVAFTALYFISGASAFIFAILSAAHELFIRRKISLPLLCIIPAALIPFAIGWHYNAQPVDIYLNHLPFHRQLSLISNNIPNALYITVLSVLIIVFVYKFFTAAKPPAKPTRKKSKTKPPLKNKKLARLGFFLQPLVLIAAAIITVHLSPDVQKKRLYADFLASNSMWTELLEYANRNPIVTNDPLGNHNIIQALHHTNRLGDELFRYPQFIEGMFLPSLQPGVRRFHRGICYIRLSLSLGRLNIAEKEAYEILENSGEYPELLWSLAKINIAKGQPETATVFLNLLSKNIIESKKAKTMLKQLQLDPQLGSSEQINQLRKNMLVQDITGEQSLEETMSDLFQANPYNKLAFEYLMLYYLKSRKVDKIAENMYRFRNFGYKKIPRHYEEAILLYLGNTGSRINPHGWKIDPQTYKTGDRFMAALKLNPPSNPASAAKLAPEFGHTYFYYYIFTKSGSRL